jgi:hypothetical protein
MKFRMIAAMAPIVLMASAAAQAQDAPSDTGSPKPAVKEKKICRTEDDTGSIVPRRICHTKAEWAAINAQQEEALNKSAMRRGQSN